jgi:hypothetical protein
MQVIEFKEFGSPSQLHLAERLLPQADANTAVVPMNWSRRASADAWS